MVAWVALLRGVNVGGVTIRSAELSQTFTGLGFASVRTVLASGNVVFETDAAASDRPKLKAQIEKALRDRFSYDAWIVLVTVDELRRAANAFPFDADDSSRQPWVIFCVDDAARDELVDAAAAMDTRADPVAAGPSVVFWNPVKGTTTDTPFAKLVAKSTYRARTTNRNLRTLRKILG